MYKLYIYIYVHTYMYSALLRYSLIRQAGVTFKIDWFGFVGAYRVPWVVVALIGF